MKLKKLKLHSAVVLNNSQMKAVWGRNGYGGNGYDDPIYDAGYLPEFEVICDQFGPRCWKWDQHLNRCVFTGNPNDFGC